MGGLKIQIRDQKRGLSLFKSLFSFHLEHTDGIGEKFREGTANAFNFPVPISIDSWPLLPPLPPSPPPPNLLSLSLSLTPKAKAVPTLSCIVGASNRPAVNLHVYFMTPPSRRFHLCLCFVSQKEIAGAGILPSFARSGPLMLLQVGTAETVPQVLI